MPQKIGFTVVYVSGESDTHRGIELNDHGPTVRGWQSAPDCPYPQEVVLQLHGQASVERIQVLSHQFLIPEKLELWVGDSTPEASTPTTADFEYLGFITLSDNRSTEFRSRELKSVTVPSRQARFLKLKLHKNHPNALNVHNQVGLIALNVLGRVESVGTDDANNNGGGQTANGNINALLLVNNPEYTSPYDDLAFEMYVDPAVAAIIRTLDEKKQQAVIAERFEFARRLKLAMSELRAAGERLGRLELDKRLAIAREDYDRAKAKKLQMDAFRQSVHDTLGVDTLLELNGIDARNDVSLEAAAAEPQMLVPATATANRAISPPGSPHHPHRVPKKQGLATRASPPPTVSPTNLQARGGIAGIPSTGSLRRRQSKPTNKSSYEAYEERTIPALRHGHVTSLRDADEALEGSTSRSKLTEREKKQAALPLTVFGNEMVEKFFSKHYADKEDGLRLLKDELRSQIARNRVPHGPNKTARATVHLLHRALRDKVFAVYCAAAEAIRMFFAEFVPSRVTAAEVARSVDRLLPELLAKSGDTTPRIHNMAVHTVLSMADCPQVRELHVIPVSLSRPMTAATHPRLALSRLEMVEQLVVNQGISTHKHSGLSCRTLSEFGSSALHHPAEAVRKLAERLLTLVYRVNPRLVRQQLPPDDDITRRNLLYRQLFAEFDVIDTQMRKDVLDRNRMVQSVSVTTSISSATTSRARPGSSSSSASAITSPSESTPPDPANANANVDRRGSDRQQCIFCAARCSESLNSHYWRACPMLTRCRHCKQVVEVSGLNQHLLDECDCHELYRRCDICLDAVMEDTPHDMCLPADGEGSHCPLCHESILPWEDGWRRHLVDDICPKHTRGRHSGGKMPSELSDQNMSMSMSCKDLNAK